MIKIILFSIFWLIGIVFAILGESKIREYKDYEHPYLIRYTGIFLCVVMSWAYVMALLMNCKYILPTSIYHNCRNYIEVTFEEEYLDKDGNKVTVNDDYDVHHTYRYYTCGKCGKIIDKTQLQ